MDPNNFNIPREPISSEKTLNSLSSVDQNSEVLSNSPSEQNISSKIAARSNQDLLNSNLDKSDLSTVSDISSSVEPDLENFEEPQKFNKAPLIIALIALLLTLLVAGLGTYFSHKSYDKTLSLAATTPIQSINPDTLKVVATSLTSSSSQNQQLLVNGNGIFSGSVTAQTITGNGGGITNINVSSCPGCVELQPNKSVTPQTGSISVTGDLTSGGLAVSGSGTFGSIGIGKTPAYALDVVGDINASKSLKVGGVTVCTVAGCIPVGGSSGSTTINGVGGILSLVGTSNQVTVTTSGTTITLSTPQDIGTSSTPTFAGLTLSSALPVSSGGTGATSLTAGGVVVGNGTAALSVATGSNGECLTIITGVPTFASCSGSGGVPNVDGITGAVTFLGSANQITVSDNSPSAGDISLTLPQNIGTGSSPTFNSLTLSTALGVGNGGSGATSLTQNGVILGNGTNALSAVAAGGAGDCLVSTAGAPIFSACPGSTGVSSVDTLTGALTLANSTGVGSTVTINNASTSALGLSEFNSTNFSVASGVVNTIQNIATSSSPTFTNLSLTGATGLTIGNNTNVGQIVLNDGTSDGFSTIIGTATLTGSNNITVPNAGRNPSCQC